MQGKILVNTFQQVEHRNQDLRTKWATTVGLPRQRLPGKVGSWQYMARILWSDIQNFPRQSWPGKEKFWFLSCHGEEFDHFSTFWRGIWWELVHFGQMGQPPPGKFSTFSKPTLPRQRTNTWLFSPGSCTATNIAKPPRLSTQIYRKRILPK